MKETPQSPESEKALLGSVLHDNRNLRMISEKIHPEDFYGKTNALLFSQMLALDRSGRTIEPIILKEYLQEKGLLEETGGEDYLNSLLVYSVSAKNIESYIMNVREKSVLRKLLEICSDISEDCYRNLPPSQVFDKAEKNLLDIIRKSSQQEFVPVKAIINEVIENIENVYEKKANIIGVPSGFTDLDRLISGFQNSDLVIIAARPSMGKTAFCLNIAANASTRFEIPVAVFSLEMSNTQLVHRMISSEAEIDQDKLKRGNLSESDFQKLVIGAGRLFDAKIFLNDSGMLSVNDLKAAARKAYVEHGIRMIIVDYLQLISGDSRESRINEISEISRSLKALAKELNIPVLALSQLSRAVEQRNDKRPILSDLRESGAIEQDADLVIFIYRDSYYNKDSKEPNIAEIIISKHRNGPTGHVKLFFQKEFTKFHDYIQR